ncbi:hypothetical protein F5Y18DRAFT_379905 [Xylariaceae sp. FL1019]|nr:hypothetical protein F5Y18DRAFT_379905 [Xylariaceae sp. FL1019]
MTVTIPVCRGFTHPFLFLVRNTLRTPSNHTVARPTLTTSPCLPPTLARQQRNLSLFRALRQKTTKPIATKSSKPNATSTKLKPLANAISQPNQPPLGFAHRLAAKSSPTTLYESSSQRLFAASSYTAGAFCFGCALVNSWFNVYNLPEGVSPFVPVGFGIVAIAFTALGTLFALRPSLIIQSIKILPSSQTKAPQTTPGLPQVMLELVVRRNAPFPLPFHKMRVRPDEVVLPNRMMQRQPVLTEQQKDAQRLADIKRRREEREYEMDHIMTAPFRDGGKAGSMIWTSIRRGLTGEGFMPVFVQGTQLKLDINGGYALENGQALDRIVKIEPNLDRAQLSSKGF